ncbi:MAG: NAD(P)/FAD-dependent oxidoreductase [Chloroflexi bacterium]|nr:NAD(P)/FAD-dependent oxidoreductase [Chloroflexota bacterium]
MTNSPFPTSHDALVIGSGPNGLAAAITLAQAGHSIRVYEAADTPGGGTRSAELTLPGFIHDVCSTAHPLGLGSPFFSRLPLADYGLAWVHPPAPLAHPQDDGTAAVLERSVAATAATLDPDADAYRRLMAPLAADWHKLAPDLLSPLPLPRHPLALARFGLLALRSARGLAASHFRGTKARALFGGMAAHSMLPLEQPLSASFGLVLGMAGHALGWPVARGGSQKIADALTAYLRALGGEVVTGTRIVHLADLPPARAVLCDIAPRQLLSLAGARLPPGYRRQLAGYRYDPGVFKIDWALDAPIPWRAAACGRAGTVHIGGTLEEIAAAERAVWRGEPPANPFVLLVQPTLFDPTRAPQGKHTAWAYCHVPHGSTFDMTARIEAQVERFAPGFRSRILARHTMSALALEQYNPNYVGGDINGGVQDLWQLFTRPVPRLVPYSTPVKGLYICSASTPPGGGVHGMCGYHAARAALRAWR